MQPAQYAARVLPHAGGFVEGGFGWAATHPDQEESDESRDNRTGENPNFGVVQQLQIFLEGKVRDEQRHCRTNACQPG